MVDELPACRICPMCHSELSLIRIGRGNYPFYVHTGVQLDTCVAIGDNENWTMRIKKMLEKVEAKRQKITELASKQEEEPYIFGVKRDSKK